MLFCALCLSVIGSGQEDSHPETTKEIIKFEYDDAGNRIVRESKDKPETGTSNSGEVPDTAGK